ncbi:S-adenosyl-L-methionine-dependent methyltransferase [Mrakia frigida]|uniref:S-adenosyl-L-methionine-dependent methyltransferase n=1 Tax=Mrakia frigida TaxID=29902 RepID=UPI003FCBF3A8
MVRFASLRLPGIKWLPTRQEPSNSTLHSALDSKAHTENRLAEYENVVNGEAIHLLYKYGWAQSFYFCRFFKGEAFSAGLARHEHYLSARMNIRPGMKVLDVGCGIGGPAQTIARFSDANITGITLNQFQCDRAANKRFEEGSFDAVYAIEATVHAPTFEGIYSEIFKVLKPGGVCGIYEWVMTDKWDPRNPEHKIIAHGIEVGDGIAEMRTQQQVHDAFVSSGFEILVEEDLADRGDAVDWYFPLEGDLSKAQTLYDYLTKVGLVPKGTHSVGEKVRILSEYLVEGGRQKLFTPMQFYLVRKPL